MANQTILDLNNTSFAAKKANLGGKLNILVEAITSGNKAAVSTFDKDQTLALNNVLSFSPSIGLGDLLNKIAMRILDGTEATQPLSEEYCNKANNAFPNVEVGNVKGLGAVLNWCLSPIVSAQESVEVIVDTKIESDNLCVGNIDIPVDTIIEAVVDNEKSTVDDGAHEQNETTVSTNETLEKVIEVEQSKPQNEIKNSKILRRK